MSTSQSFLLEAKRDRLLRALEIFSNFLIHILRLHNKNMFLLEKREKRKNKSLNENNYEISARLLFSYLFTIACSTRCSLKQSRNLLGQLVSCENKAVSFVGKNVFKENFLAVLTQIPAQTDSKEKDDSCFRTLTLNFFSNFCRRKSFLPRCHSFFEVQFLKNVHFLEILNE